MTARPLAVLALLALALAAPPASTAAADPRAALARAKEASGGARWDAVRTMTTRARLRTGGLDGSGETLADVRTGRYVTRYTIGPAKGAQGFDGERAWSQDDSGQVRLEEAANAREASANEAYRTALGYWFPERWPAEIRDGGERREEGRRFAVVSITPRGGRPFDLWIDLATGLPDRHVERGATRVHTVFLSDYREVSGVRVPFRVRATTGEPKYDDVIEVERLTLDAPIEDAAFAPPPPPAPDFAIAGGGASAEVPFELVNNHIYVDVRLDGKGPFRLLCDTGGVNVVTPELARALGLEAQGALEGSGVGEKSEDVALTRIGRVELGDASLRDQLFAVFPLATFSAVEGIPVQGLVGYEVFKRFVVRIDYAARRLTLHDPRAYRPDGRGTAVPFRFDEHSPQVDGALDGIPGTFTLDTGSRGSVAILAPFAEKHELAKRYGARVKAVTGWGVGGPVHAVLARAGKLSLGGVDVEAPVLDLALQKKGAFTDRYVAGNVGGAVLRRFTLTFDYARQLVTFERTAPEGLREPYDRSGLWLNLAEGGFEIVDVVAGGPGARAGLSPGDRVVAVDGVPAGELSLPKLRERLRLEPPGSTVRLTVEAKGKRREAKLVLADQV